MSNPYSDLPSAAFWKSGVEDCDPHAMLDIYTRKWEIGQTENIATAGSCFAQHLGRFLVRNGFNVMATEAPPPELSQDRAQALGFGQYTARYGNIYTVAQLVQLLEEVRLDTPPDEIVWQKGDRYFDALRPRIPVEGYANAQQVLDARDTHRFGVREMIKGLDIFVFTLGLTEAWRHRRCGTVYPTAPGTVAGEFDPSEVEFVNYSYSDVSQGLQEVFALIKTIRGPQASPFKVLLTVSPVPLTATANGGHILPASTYSKATLRAVAGDVARAHDNVDYFPSYEIVTNPARRSAFFDPNLRTVREEGVSAVMRVFFHHHGGQGADLAVSAAAKAEIDADCEDALLEGFARKPDATAASYPPAAAQGGLGGADRPVLFLGNSHLTSFKQAVLKTHPSLDPQHAHFVPTNWLTHMPRRSLLGKWAFARLTVRPEYHDRIADLDLRKTKGKLTVCLVGEHLLGDHILRAHGPLKAGTIGMTDGRDISPSLPRASIADSALEDFYAQKMAPQIRKLIALLEDPGVARAIWVAAPDMTERTARFRLGDGFVDSRSFVFHRQAATAAVKKILAAHPKIEFVLHDAAQNSASGFAKDIWAVNDRPWDIHTNAGYFQQAAAQVMSV